MNWFILSSVALYWGSAIYDYYSGNPLRSLLFVVYGFANIVMLYMEV